jgi:hypothetical protein
MDDQQRLHPTVDPNRHFQHRHFETKFLYHRIFVYPGISTRYSNKRSSAKEETPRSRQRFLSRLRSDSFGLKSICNFRAAARITARDVFILLGVFRGTPQVLWAKSWGRRLFSHLPYSPASHCYLSEFNNILRRLNGSQGNPTKVRPPRRFATSKLEQVSIGCCSAAPGRAREKEKAESVTVGRSDLALRPDRNVLISLIKPTIL